MLFTSQKVGPAERLNNPLLCERQLRLAVVIWRLLWEQRYSTQPDIFFSIMHYHGGQMQSIKTHPSASNKLSNLSAS